jgi:hypothetical protein
MASMADSIAGLVEFGATVLNLSATPMASYNLRTFRQAKDATPATLVLPCLVAVPEIEEDNNQWQALANSGGAPEFSFTLEHLLLAATVAESIDFSALIPDLVTLLDNYFVALKARPYFRVDSNPATHYAPMTQYRLEKLALGQTQYHAWRFRHELRLNL